DLMVEAILDGLKEEVKRSGIDLGASAELPQEEILSDPEAAAELDAPQSAA
ncbi:MAG TPA: 30S ribosomal protein S2, partial [Rhodospirillaceae bacterium]|nr:30S ribosomal protein S2 [Rhodospirillaceae bacterium]